MHTVWVENESTAPSMYTLLHIVIYVTHLSTEEDTNQRRGGQHCKCVGYNTYAAPLMSCFCYTII
jgi:aerobic-type carbon monoxide dehydrogenase small subunit (CoxS/CutS family)